MFTDVEVVIAGEGPDQKRLEELVIDNHLQSVISFPGFLNQEELEVNYRKADLFLVPGKQGYGLPILEALYREVPVVINVESRVSEILGNNPWVAISVNSSVSFTKHLLSHIQNIKKHYPSNIILADLPTQSKWATSIGIICGWWSK
jgi:glycosyltransferase involved in cell wall biosynthesis